jgi:hypothetical protein
VVASYAFSFATTSLLLVVNWWTIVAGGVVVGDDIGDVVVGGGASVDAEEIPSKDAFRSIVGWRLYMVGVTMVVAPVQAW